MTKILLNFLVPLLLSWLIASQAVVAQTSTTNQQVELARSIFAQQHQALGLVNINSNADHGFIFAPGTPQSNITQTNADAILYDWTGKNIVIPNLLGFKNQMVADTNIPALAKLCTYGYVGVLNDLVNVGTTMNDYTSLQITWAGIKALYAVGSDNTKDMPLAGMCADGYTPITNQIETYAVANGVMMVKVAPAPSTPPPQ